MQWVCRFDEWGLPLHQRKLLMGIYILPKADLFFSSQNKNNLNNLQNLNQYQQHFDVFFVQNQFKCLNQYFMFLN